MGGELCQAQSGGGGAAGEEEAPKGPAGVHLPRSWGWTAPLAVRRKGGGTCRERGSGEEGLVEGLEAVTGFLFSELTARPV